MTTRPTQVQYPRRATIRTAFQAFVGLCALVPVIVAAFGLDPKIVWLAVPIAVAAGVTRLMQIPAVNAWIERFIPWLAAEPRAKRGE